MSHFTRIKTQIKDKEVLVRCLKELGYQVHSQSKIRGYGRRREKIELAVRMDAGYDIGFVRNIGGTFSIVADWWGVTGTNQRDFSTRLQEQFEEVERKIRREYALKTVLEQTQQQGFSLVEQEEQRNGSIHIVVRRWA